MKKLRCLFNYSEGDVTWNIDIHLLNTILLTLCE